MRVIPTSAGRMRTAMTLAVLLTTPGILGSQASPERLASNRVAGWRSDIQFWLGEVGKQHYVYKSKPLPPALLKAAADLALNVPRYSDERMLFEMSRLAAYVGDGHTYVLPLAADRVPGSVIPIRFYLFSDGLFVVDAQPGFEKWIGSRLVAVGTTPAAVVLERMKTGISSDNPFGWKWIGPPFLNLRGVLEALTDVRPGERIPVTLQNRAGRVQRVRFATVPPPPMTGVPKLISSRLAGAPPIPMWLRSVERNFWMSPQSDGSLYVQFNQVRDDDTQTLKQAGASFDSALSSTRPAKVVLDVRHNNGGNSYLYPPIIDALTRWESAVPAGRLYVLTGRNTFSAAQNFIAQLDKRTRAIFVGEPSSSKPNFVGEENNLKLPWSGAIISISNRYHENIPGDTRQWMEPEIRVELSSRDYFSNRDPVMDRLAR